MVKLCSHGGKNGFDKNAATCPNCNAPAVAETALNNGPWRRFADLQTALDADRDGGAELTLLADVTGDYTIDGTQDTGIDLNGYSIHGTVDVKAVAEGTNNTTTFSNSKDTGSIKTVVAHRGANLAGSGAPAVIGTLEIADTTMWKNLLKEPDRVGFKVRNEDSTHKWYAASECKEAALYNVTIESLPITFKTLYLKVDGKNLTVTKPNLSNAEITFPYGNEAAFNSVSATGVPTFVVTYKGQTLEKDKDFTITGGGSTYDVGPCTLTIKATDNGDYTGSKSAEWTVRPLKVAASVGDIIKTYDGTTDLPANAKITLKSADSYYTGVPLRLAKGTDYEVLNACYDSADAGIKTVSFTIKLKNAGYVFEDGTTQKDFTLNGADFDDKAFQINKATVPMNNPTGTLNIINGTQQTYTYDFSKLLPEAPNGDYGTVRYDLGNRQTAINFTAHGYYLDPEIAEFEGSKLTLVGLYAKDGTATGQIGTVKVTVTTTNYENFQLKLVLNAVDQIKPEPDGTITATPITYGDTLSKSEILGTMKDPNTSATVDGTFTWTDGTIKPDAGSYDAEWTFTPAEGYEEYATATGTVTVKVKPAKLIVSVKASSMYYTGEEQIASIIASGQSVDSTPVTFTYSDKVDGNYTSGVPTFTDAGTYTAYYKAEAANHEPATGTFTVTIDPLPISLLSVSSISKTYDGSADVTLTADKLTFFSKTAKATNIKLPDTALTFSDAQFTSKQEDGSYLPSPEVGNGKALSFTMTLTSNNYVFEGKSEGTTKVSDVFATDDVNRFTITKAAAPTNIQSGTLTITNGLHKTYSFDLSTLLPKLTAPCDYGTITYDKKVDTNLGVGSFITLVNGKTGELTLEANRSGTDEGQFGTITVTISTSNYQDITLTVNIFAKNKLTPVMDGKITASKITYGQALSDSSITGKMKDPNTGDEVNGTFTWTDGAVKPDANDRYEAEWTFTPDSEEYATVTDTATVEVAPKSIEGATITLEKYEFQYNAAEQSPRITGVTLEDWSETRITYDIKSGDKATDANDSIPLTIEGIGNYTGTATVEWKITPKTVTPTMKVASCTYTGDALEPAVTLEDGDAVIPAGEYTAEYSNNTNAGTGRVTIKDVDGGNYIITSISRDFPIDQAAAPTNIQNGTLNVINGTYLTYTYDFQQLLPAAPHGDYGTVRYDLGNRQTAINFTAHGYYIDPEIAEFEGSKLTLVGLYAKDGTATGQIGTATVKVTTTNYKDFRLTLVLNAVDRITPVADGSITASKITYGQTLSESRISGTMKDPTTGAAVEGTFAWQLPDDTILDASTLGHDIGWKFTPKDGNAYTEATGTATVKVDKAQQYGKVSMKFYIYGETPSTPSLTDRTGDGSVTYYYNTTNSNSGGTEWKNIQPDTLSAGTRYYMYAELGETENYESFTTDCVKFWVMKAIPTCTKPTGLTAKYGQKLNQIALPNPEGNTPGTWRWQEPETVLDQLGTPRFYADFKPDNETYSEVLNVAIDVTVGPADGGSLKTVELAQKYTDTSEHTYKPDWSGLPGGQTWSYNSEYSVSTGSNVTLTKKDFATDGSLLTYAISGGKAGDKITLTLKASCDNYKDFTITLNITLTEKDDQKPLTITGNTSVIYGEKLTLTTTGGSGTGAVTYRIDTAHSTGEAAIDPNTGVLTPVRVGSVSVIAAKAGDNDYNDVTSAPFVLMIKPATPTGEPNYTKITTGGKTLKDAALTTKGSTLNPNDGKLEWLDDKGNALPDDTRVKANTTYKWRFTPTDTNYTTLTGEIELLHHKSNGGGGSGYSYYTIEATAGAGGSISPSGSVSVREGRDQTFTITPDKGYAVSTVKIDGKSIGAVKSYTFENVSRTHTIEVIFVKGTASARTGDSSNLPLWSALLLASTLTLAGAVHYKRKRAR